ncbi:septal ring lytic transglycosylase RlpA family protein [Telluria aromaticivorans]|uniref:Endolytic peptidoglycan transglycosylase RlpA n=1 Tax=Telluria aromaticivorans TaxID=2725995 RepID=A0A7Y2K123_9BURK|nr:septal ring lytic transglycosylase RlpA family protein [Telluria aromaticivorans]NNG24660.1 septal ring lytic transglycosylase RlpA family protein [Telluria aromaticivorans]
MAVPRKQLAAVTVVTAFTTLLTGCSTTGEHKSLIPLPWGHRPTAQHPEAPKLPAAKSGRGGYYKDDGPGANPPPGLLDLPDAIVRAEPYAKWANRPYSVLGQSYTPITHEDPFTQRGVASWYGVKFHGQKTSSGELYDMYKMTAAHPTLPIPSYVRVTSVDSGKSVIVRINDRGPFHASRVIDVSYTAALKLGLLGKGSHQVEIERLFPNDHPSRIATVRRAMTSHAQSAPPEITALMLEDTVRSDSAAVAQVVPKLVPAGSFYVQLGAYGRAGMADAMSERLAQAGLALGALEVVKVGSVNRLYGGPYATRDEAQAAARAVPASFGLKPIVVKR